MSPSRRSTRPWVNSANGNFRPLAAQPVLTIKTRYAQGVQVCGQALTSLLTVIWRRKAPLIDPDLKGWPAAMRA
jgi:hypothetical protein